MTEPAWVQYAVWWQVYPLGFTGAPVFPAGPGERVLTHRLARLVDWLDYARELGASGIALGPIFSSETHGYDTIDYFAIDPRLGDDDDFDALIREAHQRGLRVMLDGVFNHVGRAFAPFQRALAGGPDAPESAWFTRQAVGGDFANFEGHDSLVALNHTEPAVADFVCDVMTHWLARGADGWRLDAAYAVPPAFWAGVLPRVRALHPDAYVVGEIIHGDYPAIVADSALDSLTQYELWKAVWSSLSDANFFELDYALGRHNTDLDIFVPLTFIGNHDVTRIATALDDRRHLPHALVILLTVGGTPSIYYGDEQGFEGLKEDRAGGDDAIRPEFPSGGPAELSPEGWPVYHLHQHLIGLRRRHPWLHTARTSALRLTNQFYVYEVREHGGRFGGDGGRLVVLLNVGDENGRLERTTVTFDPELLAGAAAITLESVVVAPHGWAVLGVAPRE
ncbi:alpha-amylase family protein [soil metagenome]